MAIETVKAYRPKMVLPLYTRIIDPRMNDYTVGNNYDIRIEDPDRNDDGDPYNYIHEAVLIAKEDYNIKDIPDLLLAFDKHTRSRKKALDYITDNDGDVVLLIFMRLESTKEFLKKGYDEILPENFEEQHTEDVEAFMNGD